MPIVTNIFWSNGGMYTGAKLYVLYDDMTYDIFRFESELVDHYYNPELKKFLNLKQLRMKKYTKETVKRYIDDQIEKWKMEKGL
jgi:hypothetical protein